MIGYRKFLISIFAMCLIFIGLMFGKINGDTGVTGIVSIFGLIIGGYGIEYHKGGYYGKNKSNKD